MFLVKDLQKQDIFAEDVSLSPLLNKDENKNTLFEFNKAAQKLNREIPTSSKVLGT